MSDLGGSSNNGSLALGWPEQVGFMAKLCMQLEQVEPEVYPKTALHVGAKLEQLKEAEQWLSHSLDPIYREFLTYANGWPAFFQDVRLLGTKNSDGGRCGKAVNSYSTPSSKTGLFRQIFPRGLTSNRSPSVPRRSTYT